MIGRHTIRAVATKPLLRGQGIGAEALQRALDLHKGRGIVELATHSASATGRASLCGKGGLCAIEPGTNQYGYIELDGDSE